MIAMAVHERQAKANAPAQCSVERIERIQGVAAGGVEPVGDGEQIRSIDACMASACWAQWAPSAV